MREQVPAIRGERYDVGCLYVGVNDVRGLDWDAAAFERDVTVVLDALAARCDRTLALTLPLDLGLPPAGPKVVQANDIIERAAASVGASVVDLRDFTGARWVWADHVHATATGQVEIADRAARALGAERLPSQLADPPSPDLAYWWHFGRRSLRERARVALLRVRSG